MSLPPISDDQTVQVIRRRVAGGLVASLALWLTSVIAGIAWLSSYGASPGVVSAPSATWPTESTLLRRGGHSTLVMFVHPKCPCTRASLRELERLLASTGGALDFIVSFTQPPGVNSAWVQTDLWRWAQAMPGVTVQCDNDGQEALRFGAATSGEVMLFDSAGCLVFQGGITPSRGHEGDSAGRSAILKWASNTPAESCSPAYGCPLASAHAQLPRN